VQLCVGAADTEACGLPVPGLSPSPNPHLSARITRRRNEDATGHQRKSFCVKGLVGASSVVCPCIAVTGMFPQQRVIGLWRRRAGLPMMSGEITWVSQCRAGLAPTARLMRRLSR